MNSLTSVIFKNSKRADKIRSVKELLLAGLSLIIVFGTLTISMIYFSYTITKRLERIGQTYTFTNILLLMNFFILFAKSIFESLNVLYFSKDLKILLRMPIKSKTIVHAKLINMIVSEYQMETIMLAIPMIVYGIITKVNLIFYIYMIAVLIVLPIIPILLTSLVIAIIMRFTNFIKNKSKVMYITIFLTMFIMGIITSSFVSTSTVSRNAVTEIILQTNGVAEKIADYFILIKPIMNTLLNYDNLHGLQNLMIYILENILCYYIILNIISKIYLKGAIGVSINSTKNKDEVKELSIEDFKKQNKFKTYLKKEYKILNRTPIFFIQCICIPIMYPLAIFITILGLVAFATWVGLDLISILKNIALSTTGFALFIGVGQVFFMMNFTSIISISKESKNAIISKYIPISLMKQFKLRILFGMLSNIIGTAVVCIFYFICTKNIFLSVILGIILTLMNSFGEKFKLLIDLNKPRLSWESEYTMMKQNTNVMYELFYTVVLALTLYLVSKLVAIFNIFVIVILVLFLVINILINRYVNKHTYEIFGKIY